MVAGETPLTQTIQKSTQKFEACIFANMNGPLFVFKQNSIDASFSNCQFSSIESKENGSAIICKNIHFVARNCSFRDCHSDQNGGAIYFDHTQMFLYDCTFIHNTATIGSDIFISVGASVSVPQHISQWIERCHSSSDLSQIAVETPNSGLSFYNFESLSPSTEETPESSNGDYARNLPTNALSNGDRYVSASGTGGPYDCGSQSNMCKTIQLGMSDSSTSTKIYVTDCATYNLWNTLVHNRTVDIAVTNQVTPTFEFTEGEGTATTMLFKLYNDTKLHAGAPAIQTCSVFVKDATLTIEAITLACKATESVFTFIAVAVKGSLVLSKCTLKSSDSSLQVNGPFVALFKGAKLHMAECTVQGINGTTPLIYAYLPQQLLVSQVSFYNINTTYQNGCAIQAVLGTQTEEAKLMVLQTTLSFVKNQHPQGRGIIHVTLLSDRAFYPAVHGMPCQTDKYALWFSNNTFADTCAATAKTVFIEAVDLNVALHPNIHNNSQLFLNPYDPLNPTNQNYFQGIDSTYFTSKVDLRRFVSETFVSAVFVSADVASESTTCGPVIDMCGSFQSGYSKFTAVGTKHFYLDGHLHIEDSISVESVIIRGLSKTSRYTLIIDEMPNSEGSAVSTVGEVSVTNAYIVLPAATDSKVKTVFNVLEGSLTLSNVEVDMASGVSKTSLRFISAEPSVNSLKLLTVVIDDVVSTHSSTGFIDASEFSTVQVQSADVDDTSLSAPLFFIKDRPLYGSIYIGFNQFDINRAEGTSFLQLEGTRSQIATMIESSKFEFGWTIPTQGSLISVTDLSELKILSCTFSGKGRQIALPLENPFFWDTSAISATATRVTIISSSFKKISEGSLSVSETTTAIQDCTFANNSPQSAEFPEFRRNALCKHSNFSLTSPAGGDGVTSESLWILDDGCTFSGVTASLQSTLFTPVLQEVKKTLSPTELKLEFSGTFPIPDGLAFALIYTSTSNAMSIDMASTPTFSFDSDSTSSSLKGTVKRSQIDETQSCHVVLTLNGESVPSESGSDQTSILVKGEWGEMFPDSPDDPDDPTPDDPKGLSTKNIIIIAASAGGGVLGVTLVVVVIGTAALRRRRREHMGKGAEAEDGEEEEESECDTETTIDELDVNEIMMSEQAPATVTDNGTEELANPKYEKTPKKKGKKKTLKSSKTKVAVKPDQNNKQPQKATTAKSVKRKPTNKLAKVQTTLPQNQKTTPTESPSAPEPTPTAFVNALPPLPTTLLKGRNAVPSLSKFTSLRLNEITSNTLPTDPNTPQLNSLLFNTDGADQHETDRFLMGHSFGTDRTQSSSKPRQSTDASIFAPPSKYLSGSIRGDETERNPQSLFFGLSMELNNEDEEHEVDNPIQRAPSSQSLHPSMIPTVSSPTLSNYSLVKSHAKAHPETSFLTVPSSTLPVLTKGQELERVTPWSEMNVVSADWGYERMYMGNVDKVDVPAQLPHATYDESSGDDSDAEEPLLEPPTNNMTETKGKKKKNTKKNVKKKTGVNRSMTGASSSFNGNPNKKRI